jgi:hypothetical protein
MPAIVFLFAGMARSYSGFQNLSAIERGFA